MMYGHARTEGIHSKMTSQTSNALWSVCALGKGAHPGHRPSLLLLSNGAERLRVRLNQSKRNREYEMKRAGVTPAAKSGNKNLSVSAPLPLSFTSTGRVSILVRHHLSPWLRWPLIRKCAGFSGTPFPQASAWPSRARPAGPL
jgi:hypothetical protein